MSKQVNIIVAVAKNGVIGANNKLPWSIPGDLQRFKELTQLSTVVMGRKTWESLPFRPLKNRDNIVISRQAEYYASGARVVSSLDDAINTAVTDTVWVIGGAEIYEQAIKVVSRLYLTEVNAYPDGDAVFPLEWYYSLVLEKCEPQFTDGKATHRFLVFKRN